MGRTPIRRLLVRIPGTSRICWTPATWWWSRFRWKRVARWRSRLRSTVSFSPPNAREGCASTPGNRAAESHRLTFKTSPADPGQFLKAWDESFTWEMMTHPLLTRVQGGKQIYLNGRRLQIRTHTGVVRKELDPAKSCTGRSPRPSESPFAVVRTALAILDDASRGSS